MPVVHDALLLAHLLGFVAVLGGLLVQVRDSEPEISRWIFWGTLVQFASGVALVVIPETPPTPSQWYRIGTKVALSLVLLVLVIANRRWTSIPKSLWAFLVVLVLAITCVAVFWH